MNMLTHAIIVFSLMCSKILHAINAASIFSHHPLASVTIYDPALIHINAFKLFKREDSAVLACACVTHTRLMRIDSA